MRAFNIMEVAKGLFGCAEQFQGTVSVRGARAVQLMPYPARQQLRVRHVGDDYHTFADRVAARAAKWSDRLHCTNKFARRGDRRDQAPERSGSVGVAVVSSGRTAVPGCRGWGRGADATD